MDMIGAIVAAFAIFFRSRLDISLEVLALRQQVAVLKRKRRRPVLSRLDRLFWIMLRNVWPRWSDVLAIVKPATVIGWLWERLPTVLAVAIQAAERST